MSFWKKSQSASGGGATPPTELLRCSFCNKTQDDVRKLIAGPTVFICDECVGVCVEIMADDSRFERLPQAFADADPAATQPPLAAKDMPATVSEDASTVVECSLCRMPMVLAEGLPIGDRGVLCAGCEQAVQIAIAERRPDS